MNRLLVLATALLVALPTAAQPRLFAPADGARTGLSAQQATYLGHLEAPRAAETHLVTADPGVLDAATLTFNLAPDAAVTLTRSRVERRFGDGASYLFEGADDGTFAVVVEREGQLTGNVRVNGQLWAVRPLTGGLHAVVRMDESRFPADHPPEWEAVEAEAARRWAETPYVPREVPVPEGEDGGFALRVLVPYTPTAASQVADILALIQLAFFETNVAYDRSGLFLQVVPAYVFETAQDETGATMTTLLDRLENPIDGWYDEVLPLRGDYGADMVNMILRSGHSFCGVASTILATGLSDSYSVTSHECATGNYTFGHELGHLQGCRHNPEADPNQSPFPYGHGKYYAPGDWRTVMSYDCPGGGCTRVPNFSNPDVDYNGVPTGDVALRDNARVLAETAVDMSLIIGSPQEGWASVEVERLSGPTIPASGGLVQFRITLESHNGSFRGDAWVSATLPNGNLYPLFGPQLVRLGNGQIVSRVLQINVPGAAPGGTYTISTWAGDHPSDYTGSDFLTFRKLASERVAADDGWAGLVVIDATEEAMDDAPVASSGTEAPAASLLHAATPNPFAARTTLRYDVAEDGDVRLAVYDLLGREVAVLVEGARPAGSHEVAFDAASLPSGVYLARMTTRSGFAQTRTVTLHR